MELSFWGVRGCIAAPGPEFVRYGGNTNCVTVRAGDDLAIFDAGTGIIQLGRSLMGEGFGKGQGKASLFLTHAHWDHIQGFPFFGPVFVPGNQITIYGSCSSPEMLEGIFEGQMNPHFMPVQSLRNLGASIDFCALEPDEERRVGALRVRGRFNLHGRVSAFAFRVEHGEGDALRSLVYAPDAEYPQGAPPEALLELYAGADVLIHDSTYSPEDYEARVGRGYSSIAHAARAAALAGVGKLALFHYDQDYTDDQLDALAARGRELLDGEAGGTKVELVAAREGLTLTI
ncbi:MAG: MBL fold metallo-hydrolase [Proteobacteria bacterium]|nr:MAG: MBL fold metallo-hydrolase [Pseudomonadota bacterium]